MDTLTKCSKHIHYEEKSKTYIFPLITLTILFFFCGFITSMNDVLIPKLKSSFRLNYFESMLVQFCFFLAYFIISFIYYILSLYRRNTIIKLGYKNIIIIGLIISCIGSLLFYPASNMHSYPSFLLALFILASGITLLQISANPYVTLLGTPENSSGRLSLTQAFNSLGSTVAPLIGGKLILDVSINHLDNNNISILPYLIISLILFFIAIIINITKLPEIIYDYNNKKIKLYSENLIKKYRHLKYGVIAIFMYVGGEVSINSLIIAFLIDINIAGLSENHAAQFLSFYWAGTMIGRFFGAIFLSKMKNKNKLILLIIILIIGFFYSAIMVNLNINIIKYFWTLIIINMVTFYFINKNISHNILSIFSILVITLLIIAISSSSIFAIWSIIGIGLFNSIMFPTIFSLAIRDLYNDTSKGSSLLIMAIVGGAIIPLVQGKLADITNVQFSYLIPIICYIYVFFYGINGYKKINK